MVLPASCARSATNYSHSNSLLKQPANCKASLTIVDSFRICISPTHTLFLQNYPSSQNSIFLEAEEHENGVIWGFLVCRQLGHPDSC